MKNVRSVLKFHLLCFNILFFYVLIYYYCCKWRSTSSLRLNEDGMQLENGKETKMKAPMTLILSMPAYIFDNRDLHLHRLVTCSPLTYRNVQYFMYNTSLESPDICQFVVCLVKSWKGILGMLLFIHLACHI